MTLPDFSAVRVLVIGDVFLDVYWRGEVNRISPEAPVPVVNLTDVDYRPGGAANVAMNAAALGAQVTLCGIVGLDKDAERLKHLLWDANVVHHLCQYQVPTIRKVRVLSDGHQIARVDVEQSLEQFAIPEMGFNPSVHIGGADVVIFSDYAKGTLRRIRQHMQAAIDADIPRVVDPKHRHWSAYGSATVITPNAQELPVGRSHRTIREQFGIEAILTTLGPKGMELYEGPHKKIARIPAQCHQVYDVTGAGDTVAATLGVALGAGMPLLEAAKLANRAAGIVVGKVGTATVSREELIEVVRLSETDWKMLQKNLEDPPPPNKALRDLVRKEDPGAGRTVFTCGCFDCFHEGHEYFLREAAKLGDRLIVAVNTDESVRELKGEGRPRQPLKERLKNVRMLLKSPSVVLPFNGNVAEMLERFEPDVYVKGEDWPWRRMFLDLPKRLVAHTRLYRVSRLPGVSTTEILEDV